MKALRMLLAGMVAVAAVMLMASPALAAGAGFERIISQDVDISIEPSGELAVTEVINYDFGTEARHGILHDIAVRERFDAEHDRVYRISDVAVAASPGTPSQFRLEHDAGLARIRIGDPDRTITGAHTYTVAYRVSGALNGFADHDELYWDALGDRTSVMRERVAVRVTAPAAITTVRCLTGATGASHKCSQTTVEGDKVSFDHAWLHPSQNLTVVVAFPRGVVPAPAPLLEPRAAAFPSWTRITAAFAVTPQTVAAAAGLSALAVAVLGALLWRTGRDRQFTGSAVDAAFGTTNGTHRRVGLLGNRHTSLEFAPPDGVTPGQIGTLFDERVDARDVAATVIDLARRGYLRIEEIRANPKKKPHDWKLVKLRDPDDLAEHEVLLMDGLFRSKKSPSVRLSKLASRFAETYAEVEAALYADAVHRGWFHRRPDEVRSGWWWAGFLLVLAGAGAAVAAVMTRTPLALVAVPVVLAGVLTMAGGRYAPRRTPEGTAALRRARAFRRFIEESDAPRARYAEDRNLFTTYLPYAIAFGAATRWAQTFADLGAESPDWYVGRGHSRLDTLLLVDGLERFNVSAASALTSVDTSGSGGLISGLFDGTAGGGGGGGGTSSW